MRVIYKYPLPLDRANEDGSYTVLMHSEAEICHVASQSGNDITIWAEVVTDCLKTAAVFEVYGTGHKIPHGEREFVGTVFMDGSFVFHVYLRTQL